MVQYIIQPEDTLYFIAMKFNTSVSAIMKANNLSDPHRIYPGQTIFIPVMMPSHYLPKSLPIIRYGDKGPLVHLLQNKLTTAGFYNGILSGVFDPYTQEALKQFQRDHQLHASGTVTGDTWRLLNEVKETPSASVPFDCRFSAPGLLLILNIPRKRYKSGSSLEIQLFKLNLSAYPVQLDYRTSQHYDFIIQDFMGQTLWNWSMDKSFAQVLNSRKIEPSQLIVDKEAFVLPDATPPGVYHLIGWNTARQTEGVNLHISFEVYH